jgi:hypothetical protein
MAVSLLAAAVSDLVFMPTFFRSHGDCARGMRERQHERQAERRSTARLYKGFSTISAHVSAAADLAQY